MDDRFAAGQRVTVLLPPKADFGKDETFRILESLLDRLGCGGCYSGFDIRFRHEVSFLYDAASKDLVSNQQQL